MRPVYSKGSLVAAALLAASCAFAGNAIARDWPAKPIRIVVPYPPGGTSDVLARAIGQKLNDAWGQPVIVENRPGANGNIGAGLVARAPADGYTLMLADVGALAISASVYRDLQFHPRTSFQPVVMVSYSPHVLGVHPSVAANSVQELIELARSNPGALNIATAGAGSATHLAAVEFAQRAGIRWTYVHYKGGSQAVTDIVAGHADALFNGMLPVHPHVKSGKIRALAVTSPQRAGAAPAIPTVAESGLAGFETGSWQGVLAPAQTPRAVVDKLNDGIRRILATPAMNAQLAAQGTEVRAGTPEAMSSFLQAEIARWSKVVKDSGVKAE